MDLFDTEPDLAGNDVDISRFIRDDADIDVQVFWRRWDGDAPPDDLSAPAREELCPVPVREVRAFLSGQGAHNGRRIGYVWDHLSRAWRRVAAKDLRPGMVLLLHAEAGGYRAEVGWDPQRVALVDPVIIPGPPAREEGMGDEPLEEVRGAWVPLSEHLDQVERRLAELVASVAAQVDAWAVRALRVAARWHDVGKAHCVFQQALLSLLPEHERAARAQRLWAKSPYADRRLDFQGRYFRHELASALALLEAPPRVHGLGNAELDLAAYLGAAHHGKVRLAIRPLPGEKRPSDADRRFARGIWEGDCLGPVDLGNGNILPRTCLDLEVIEAGRGSGGQRSWVERTLRLRDALGPFRLAFLEALLRTADWDVSYAETSSGAGEGNA